MSGAMLVLSSNVVLQAVANRPDVLTAQGMRASDS
jgi:hypothetical protein